QNRLKCIPACPDTMGSTPDGGTPYGTDNRSPPANDSPDAASPRPPLRTMRRIDVGGLSQLSDHHPIGHCTPPHLADSSLQEFGVFPVCEALSSGRGGPSSTPQTRVWA